MNRGLGWFVLAVVCWLSLSSCEDKDPASASRTTLLKAMNKLQKGDVEGYCRYLDFGQELDSLTEAQIAKMWVMHEKINLNTKGEVMAVDVVKVDVVADTLTTVYYKIKYASGNEEVSSDKLVRIGGEWKIRVRN